MLSASAALSVLIAAAGTLQAPPAAADTTGSSTGSQVATQLSVEQASAQAQATGKDVQAGAATTDSSTTTAHADGTFTVSQSLAPVRKDVDGTWEGLNPTLVRNPDGSISTAVTSSDLTLSSGGGGPLATMNSQGRQLAVSLPMTLPAPTLSGATATYSNVLSGVDLAVTATAQGGFSEVLVVKNAAAAANPALKSLTLATRTTGVTLTSDAAGNVTASDPQKQPVFTAPAPTMWDSATAATPAPASSASPSAAPSPSATASGARAQSLMRASATVQDPITGQQVDSSSGLPVSSSATSPGEGAHTAPIAAAVSGDDIKLTPAASLLTGSGTVYPVYVDPSFNPPSASSPLQAWTQTNSYYHSASYWKSSDLLRVGDQDWESPTFVARSFVQIGVPSQVYGSQILSSQLNFNEEWSPDCTATGVQLYNSNAISSATTWDNPAALGSQVGATQTVAHGYNSSCPAAGVPFDISSAMTSAANNKWSNITFGLRASDESDPNGWKEFANTITVSTTYDHAPNTPTNLSTSPATSCTGGGVVGDGEVTLYAKLSDTDGGTLGATFNVTRGTDKKVVATSNPNLLTVGSNSTAVLQLSQANLEAWAGKTSTAPGAATTFTWTVQSTDFKLNSSTTTPCSFTFDPTRPGTPIVSDSNGIDLSAYGSGSNPATFGTTNTPIGVTFSTPTGTTAAAGFVYELNSGAPRTVSAANGTASVTITPTRPTNTLTVTAVSASGNYAAQAADATFNSTINATQQADQDLTGDGIPDLLTVGGQDGLASGLWLSPGQSATGRKTGTGHVSGSISDLGINGSGISTTGPNGLGSPSDYNGATAFSGQFTDDGLQDVFTYYPATGVGEVLGGNGDGSPLTIANDNTPANGLYPQFGSVLNPLQLANAGFTSHSTGGGNSSPYADLIGTEDNGAGTGTDTLMLFPSGGFIGSYNPVALDNPAPASDANWADWTLTTTQLPSTVSSPNVPGTAMFLWNKKSGELDLWEGLSQSTDAANGQPDISYTPFQIATGWNTGKAITLQAADINGDGTPDLWAVGSATGTSSANTETAYLFGNLTTAGPATVTTSSDVLATDTHSWALNDNTSGATGSTGTQPADTTGGAALTGTSGATWNSGDLFSPDVSLDGKTGTLTAAGPAVSVNSNFTVSAWIKPNALGGVAISQPGVHSSGMIIYPDTGTDRWYFCLATGDTTAWSYNCAAGSAGPVQLGTWAHVTATYNTSGRMALYINGIDVSTSTHTALSPDPFTGKFTIGDYLYDNAASSYFNGQVSQVETWNQTLTPTQVAGLSDTTQDAVFAANGATYPSGSSWTVGVNTMTFNQGQMTVSVAGTPLYQVGTTTSPGAVLTLQSDGNLVAYDNAADAAAANGTGALWSTKTYGSTADTKGSAMLLQADGNLVIYAADGAVLWSSATNNPGADQWQLNSSAADTAGTNTGIASSSVTWGANHKGTANAAAIFNGTDSVVRAAAPAVNTSQSYTVSAWVKINALGGTQIALGQGTLSHQAFYLGYHDTNGGWIFQTTTADGTATTSFPTASAPATAGVWTHLVGVYNATNGAMTLYVNGVAKGTATNTTPQYVPSGVLTIGANQAAGATALYGQLTGSISDVRTYPNAFTAAQVAAIYNS